jgi:hypothetical protein
LWSVRSGWIFLDFRRFPSSQLLPRGRPHRCCKPYDIAFDRSLPVSPDSILGLNATPVPRSGTVLPNLSSGSCGSFRPCGRLFRLSAGQLSSTSRFPSTSLQPRGISAPSRPGDGFGFITCRLLRSANYPCRLRATVHPDRLPSSIRNPGLLSLLRVDSHRFSVLRRCFRWFSKGCKQLSQSLVVLSSLAIRLHGLCSHEHPDCSGPGYSVDEVVTPRPTWVCRLPLCLRFTVRRTETLSGAS